MATQARYIHPNVRTNNEDMRTWSYWILWLEIQQAKSGDMGENDWNCVTLYNEREI